MNTKFAKQLLIILLVGLVALATWTTNLDAPAMEEVDAGMKRALASFAVARALNAAISLAQGTEFSAGILSTNVTFSVGEVLDPVNDMVESFSNLMLIASVAFGIQKMLLLIGQDALIKWLLTGALGAWAAFFLANRRYRWLDVTLILMLMVRFAVPVVTMATDAMYQRYLLSSYEESTTALVDATDEMSKTTEDLRQKAAAEMAAAPETAPPQATSTDAKTQDQKPEPSVWDSVTGAVRDNVNAVVGAVRDNVKAVAAKIDPRFYIERLKEQASNATKHIIQLMVVFALQTLLVPLFLLWGMYTALRGVLAGALTS